MPNGDQRVDRSWPYLATILQTKKTAEAGPPTLAKQGRVASFPPGLLLATFWLGIDRVDPPVPTRGRGASVAFTLTNNSGRASSGTVSSNWGGSVEIHNLASDTSASATLSVVPTRSGKGISLVVSYVEAGAQRIGEFPQVAAQDEALLNVSTGYILEIADTFINPDRSLQTPGSAGQVCQNRTATDAANVVAGRPTLEWEPVLDPSDELDSNVGISGWVCSVDRKPPVDPTRDVPFLHPFYNDWTLYLAADPQFANLLAPGGRVALDRDVTPGDAAARDALVYAQQHSDKIAVPVVEGFPAFIEFEMEQGLLTGDYWPSEAGERLAALGRWIVDCGHDNFSSEIHPPLILARATESGDATHVRLIGRAFLTSQWFGQQTLLQLLLGELTAKEVEAGAALALFPPALAAISPMKAIPMVLSPPFSGLQSVMLTVRPPSARLSPEDKLLLSYHFTVRTGVYVSAFAGENPDEVAVLVILNDAGYTPARIPQPQEISVSFDDLIRGAGSGRQALQAILGTAIGLNPAVEAVLAKGIVTTRYTLPPPESPKDGENVVTDQVVDAGLRVPPMPYAVDDDQPYPIYGWLNLKWRRARPLSGDVIGRHPRAEAGARGRRRRIQPEPPA